MRQLNATQSLDEKILMLEGRKVYELQQLKEQWGTTYESMKPVNLIKSAFHEVTTSPDVKHNVVNTVVGLASGYLSKKILFGTTHNPISKVAASILQFAVTNIVGKKMAARDERKEQEEEDPSMSRTQ